MMAREGEDQDGIRHSREDLSPMELSRSVRQLADALDLLANLIEQQKNKEAVNFLKEFALILNRRLPGTSENPEMVQDRKMIRDKFEKGFLNQWLSKRNIIAAGGSGSLKVDAYLSEASHFLARHYQELKPFYQQLKIHSNRRKDFRSKVHLSSIEYIQKWCDMLHEFKLIDGYKKTGSEFFVEIAEIHKATHFIQGYWLEVLLRSTVSQLMAQYLHSIDHFDLLSQLGIQLPDGQRSEIDLLLMINGEVYWFECKSGTLGEYYEKFSRQGGLMNLDERSSFLVYPEANPNMATHLRVQSKMSFLTATGLKEQLEENIFKPLSL